MSLARTSETRAAQFSTYFPNPVTQALSVLFMQKIVGLSISTICYIRKILPPECYVNQMIDRLPLRILSEKSPNPESRHLLKLMRGAFDAIDKGYLKQLIFAIHEGSVKNPVLETYTYFFKYTGLDLECTLQENTGALKEQFKVSRVEDISDTLKISTLNLLKACLVLKKEFGPLPTNRVIRLKLLYYDDTPDEYEPDGFHPADDSEHTYASESNPVKFTLGKIATNFHLAKLQMRSVCYEKENFNNSQDTCIDIESPAASQTLPSLEASSIKQSVEKFNDSIAPLQNFPENQLNQNTLPLSADAEPEKKLDINETVNSSMKICAIEVNGKTDTFAIPPVETLHNNADITDITTYICADKVNKQGVESDTGSILSGNDRIVDIPDKNHMESMTNESNNDENVLGESLRREKRGRNETFGNIYEGKENSMSRNKKRAKLQKENPGQTNIKNNSSGASSKRVSKKSRFSTADIHNDVTDMDVINSSRLSELDVLDTNMDKTSADTRDETVTRMSGKKRRLFPKQINNGGSPMKVHRKQKRGILSHREKSDSCGIEKTSVSIRETEITGEDRVVRCECDIKKEILLMAQCNFCKTWQHAACYRKNDTEFIEKHCCVYCAKEDPDRQCSDPSLLTSDKSKYQTKCVFRCALVLCAELETIGVELIADTLCLSKKSALSLINVLQKLHILPPGSHEENMKIDRKILSEIIQKEFYKKGE